MHLPLLGSVSEYEVRVDSLHISMITVSLHGYLYVGDENKHGS